MIRVTIQLLPFGNEANARHLGTIDIANDGTGTAERGNEEQHVHVDRTGVSAARVFAPLLPPRHAGQLGHLLASQAQIVFQTLHIGGGGRCVLNHAAS